MQEVSEGETILREQSVKYLSSEVLVDTKKGEIYSVISSIFSSVEIF